MNPTANELREEALKLAEAGYAVFPCVPGGKRPATPQGFRNATTDPGRIEPSWSGSMPYNIGLSCAGLLVVDVDPMPDGKSNPLPDGLSNDQHAELVATPSATT